MNKTQKYLIVSSLTIIMAISILPRLGMAQQTTASAIQAQINALMQQLTQLQNQLAQLQGGTTQWCHTFNTNLKIGDSSSEVSALTTTLAKEGFSVSGSTFDESVASAVTGFQEKYKSEILTPLGLQYGTGYVGSATRAKLNKLYGCSGNISSTPSTSPTSLTTPQTPMPTSTTPTPGEPNLGQIHYLVKNGEPSDKLDILFIPQRIDDASLLEPFIKKLFYNNAAPYRKGLFLTQPFSKYEQKFNIAYVDQSIDETFFNCWLQTIGNGPPMPNPQHGCDTEKIKNYYKVFNPDYIEIVFKLPPGYRSTGGEIMFLQTDASDDIVGLFIHEFGHQFGGLPDLYGGSTGQVSPVCSYADDGSCYADYARGISVLANIDTLGCPKWCQSFDINKLKDGNKVCSQRLTKEACLVGPLCNWYETEHPFLGTHCVGSSAVNDIGLSCRAGTGCYFGADYDLLAFKPDPFGGIMESQDNPEFDILSAEHLDTALSCCFPRSESQSCQDFRQPLENPPATTNYYFRTALRKIAYCGVTLPSYNPPAASLEINTTKMPIKVGESFSVTWNNPGTAYARDWIALAPVSSIWSSGLPWFYTDGAKSGAKIMTAPTNGGEYEILYYGNDGSIKARGPKIKIISSSITVLSPNGGEQFKKGDAFTVKWTPGDPGVRQIYIRKTDGSFATNIMALSYSNTSGVWSLNVPDGWPLGQYYVEIYKSDAGMDLLDKSDAPFSIVAANPITVLSPNGGESWQIGTTQTIQWTTAGSISKSATVDIYLRANYQCPQGTECMVTPLYIMRGAPNTGSFNWTVGNYSGGTADAGQYIIAISDSVNNISDSSDAPFSIVALPKLSVSPAQTNAGSPVTVSWNSVGMATPTDWVGLFVSGTSDTNYLDWFYTSTCTKAAGSAKASGSCTYTLPSNLQEGHYEFRLFANNGSTKLADTLFSIGAAPIPTCITDIMCVSGYTGHDTGRKNSNGCPILECIPTTTLENNQNQTANALNTIQAALNQISNEIKQLIR